jgi:hypothetical protein
VRPSTVSENLQYQTYVEGMDPEDMPTVPLATVTPRFRELDSNSDSLLTLEELCVELRMCQQTDADYRSQLQRTLETVDTTPAQMHLVITANFASVLISWAQNSTSSQSVQWDTVSRAGGGAYANSAVATVTSYSVEDVGITYNSLPLYTGDLSPLVASTSYFYRVGSDAAGWSPEYNFWSMPDPTVAPIPGAVSKLLVFGGECGSRTMLTHFIALFLNSRY